MRRPKKKLSSEEIDKGQPSKLLNVDKEKLLGITRTSSGGGIPDKVQDEPDQVEIVIPSQDLTKDQ